MRFYDQPQKAMKHLERKESQLNEKKKQRLQKQQAYQIQKEKEEKKYRLQQKATNKQAKAKEKEKKRFKVKSEVKTEIKNEAVQNNQMQIDYEEVSKNVKLFKQFQEEMNLIENEGQLTKIRPNTNTQPKHKKSSKNSKKQDRDLEYSIKRILIENKRKGTEIERQPILTVSERQKQLDGDALKEQKTEEINKKKLRLHEQLADMIEKQRQNKNLTMFGDNKQKRDKSGEQATNSSSEQPIERPTITKNKISNHKNNYHLDISPDNLPIILKDAKPKIHKVFSKTVKTPIPLNQQTPKQKQPQKQKQRQKQKQTQKRTKKDPMQIIQELKFKQQQEENQIASIMSDKYQPQNVHYRYKKNTLLMNLLVDEIHAEHNVLLQALKFIENENFFQKC